jgi:hypothetical protein
MFMLDRIIYYMGPDFLRVSVFSTQSPGTPDAQGLGGGQRNAQESHMYCNEHGSIPTLIRI